MENTINIKNMLRGVTVGNLQTAGNMSVIPLLMDRRYQKQEFTTVSKLKFNSRNYGSMTFENPEDRIGIVPIGYTYVDKTQGQDHALPHTGMVLGNKSRKYNTAACVQETTGGRITSKDDIEYRLLPYSLRQYCIEKRDVKKYGKIWPYIKNMNREFKVSSRSAHLEFFFDKYDKELETFVAQFELVPRQVGAIVLIGKQVVGIELTPCEEFWSDVWEKIIRDVYGSLSILRAKGSVRTFRKPFKTRARTVEGLKRAVQKELQKHSDFVKDIANEFITMDVSTSVDDSITWKGNTYSVSTVEDPKLSGQFVLDGYEPVYISVSVLKDFKIGQATQSRRRYNERPDFGF